MRVSSALCTLSECWAGVWSGGELAISIPSCRLSAQSQIPLPCNIGKLANSLLYFQHQMKINTDFTQHSSTITHQITSLSILMQSTSSVQIHTLNILCLTLLLLCDIDIQVPSFSIRLNIVRSSRGRWWLCEVHRVVGVVGEGRGVQRVHVGLLLPAAGLVLLVTLLHLLAWLLVMVLVLVMLLLLLLLILHRGRHWHWQY